MFDDSVIPASEWEFVSPLGAEMYVLMRALHEFSAGPPSQYGYCEPGEDIAMMVAYLKRRDAMKWKDEKEAERKREERNKSRRLGRGGGVRR